MRTITTCCDRCGQPALGNLTRLLVQVGQPPAGSSFDDATGKHAVDLCSPCTEALGRFLVEKELAGTLAAG